MLKRVITIDGPAGSGKSTTAKGVAEALGWQYIDTGAMYRALGLAVVNTGKDPENADDVRPVIDDVEIELLPVLPVQILLNGTDVSDKIRSPEVSQAASQVSVHSFVRRKLVELQQQIGNQAPSVLEGRDTGTVVFPDAGLKIYLDADVNTRARRRLLDYEAQGKSIDLQEVIEDLRERDYRDANRDDSPMIRAEDAVRLDTTGMTIEEQIAKVVEMANARFELQEQV